MVANGGDPGAQATTELYSIPDGTWAAAPPLNTGGTNFQAEQLVDSLILTAGGTDAAGNVLATSEIYDGDTWTTTLGKMSTGRTRFQLVVLPASTSNLVMAAGGLTAASATAASASVDLFNPATGGWAPTTGMLAARYNFQAVHLPNSRSMPSGRVIVAGGYGTSGALFPTTTASEYYDVAAVAWTGISGCTPRAAFQMVLLDVLSNNPILAACGVGAGGNPVTTSQTYSYLPAAPTRTWQTTTTAMGTARSKFQMVTLQDGRALAVGGLGAGGVTLRSAELYSPNVFVTHTTYVWLSVNPLETARAAFSMVVVPDGRIVATGGHHLTPLEPRSP